MVAIATHKPPPSPVSRTVSIEIRTDPPGALIRLGARSCTTPHCQFDVPPGSYPLDARLEGYLEQQRTLDVNSKGVYELMMQPQPAPPPKPEVAGSVVVQTGVEGAVVEVDGKPRTRTGQSGSVTLPLEAGKYQIAVEKNGYAKPAPREVTVRPGAPETASFHLIAEPARPGPAAAPARADGSAPAPVPTPPAPLSTEAIEARDWDAVKGSNDIAQLRAFIQQHPGGAHAAQAEARLGELSWAAADKNSEDSLRQFVRDNPGNPRVNDAQTRIAELVWNKLDKSNAGALRAFVEQNPNSVYRSQAQNLLDSLDKQRQDAELRSKQDTEARQKAEAKQNTDAERTQVLAALARLNAAYAHHSRKELTALWSRAPKGYLDAIAQPHVTVEFDAIAPPEIAGSTTANLLCNEITKNTQGASSAPQRVIITLQHAAGGWLLVSIGPAQ